MARPTFRSRLADFGNWLSERPQAMWAWMKENPKKALFFGLIGAAGIAAVAAFPPLVALLPAVPYVGPLVLATLSVVGSVAAPLVFSAIAAVAMALVSGLILGTIHLFQNTRKPKGPGSSSVEAIFHEDELQDDTDEITSPSEDPLRKLNASPVPQAVQPEAVTTDVDEARSAETPPPRSPTPPAPGSAVNPHSFHAISVDEEVARPQSQPSAAEAPDFAASV